MSQRPGQPLLYGPETVANDDWLNKFAAERGFYGQDAVYATQDADKLAYQAGEAMLNKQMVINNNQNQADNKLLKYDALTMGLSSIGLIGGVLFAMHRKSSVWGYIGWAIAGSIAGSGVGLAVNSFRIKD
jgi:hypothetical protein